MRGSQFYLKVRGEMHTHSDRYCSLFKCQINQVLCVCTWLGFNINLLCLCLCTKYVLLLYVIFVCRVIWMREKSQKFHCRTVRNNKRREAEEFQKCVQNVSQECVLPLSLSHSLHFSMDRYNHLSKHQTQPAIHTFVCPRLCLCASFCGNLLWLPFVVCEPSCLCVCIGKPLKVRGRGKHTHRQTHKFWHYKYAFDMLSSKAIPLHYAYATWHPQEIWACTYILPHDVSIVGLLTSLLFLTLYVVFKSHMVSFNLAL